MDIIKNNDEFKKNVGEFILSFSEMEFHISRLITILTYGVSHDKVDRDIHGLSFKNKTSKLSELLKGNATLYKNWERILTKISDCNEFRRGITHGVVMNHIPNPYIQILVTKKRGFGYMKLTNEIILKNFRLLGEVNSGKNGLGQFHEDIVNWKNTKDSLS